jgi:hypothetical protein
MIEGYGSLDESLIKLSRRPPVFGPEFLPDLMALVVVALVEFLDALEIQGLVGGGVHGRLTESGGGQDVRARREL